LESEDADIETALHDDSLTRYQELTHVQDEQVNNAVKQMEKEIKHPEQKLRHNDNGFEAKMIHETWADREVSDRRNERRIHADPDLRMLQTSDSLRREKVAF